MHRFAALMRALIATVLLTAVAATAPAHPGHGEPISEQEAVQRATGQISRLAAAGKIESSWKLNATLKTAALRQNGADREWQLVFWNPQASEDAERTLYVFLSDTGEYLAANFTGR